MKAPEELLAVWRTFDGFPMETLTKAWFYSKSGDKKQRDVALMKEHRDRYGITGNCFDLALWLLDAFAEAGVKAYPVGSALGTEDAHAAVVAEDGRGQRFLCDLGDQWLQPILIDRDQQDFTNEKLAGFFPGAEVQVFPEGENFEILYHRPNGKKSKQLYSSKPVDTEEFWGAAEFSQNHISPKVLLEVRLPYKNETAHWEFYNWESFLSTSEGLFLDEPLVTLEEWVERIHGKTGYDREFLREALSLYKEMGMAGAEIL